MNNDFQNVDLNTNEIVITPEEIADINFDLFDPNEIEIPASLRNAKHLLHRLIGSEAIPSERLNVLRNGCPAPLRGAGQAPVADTGGCGLVDSRVPQLASVVARAYADVRSDRSIDYIVAEPEANLLFLQRCWELGAAATPFELNWVLMNARKNGKLEELDLSRSVRVAVPKNRLDRFSFAADMAMRHLLDRLYYEQQQDVSIDRVLCDPRLSKEFDSLARCLAPDFSVFEYRWAVISMRKARRAKAVLKGDPSFFDCGLVEDVRTSVLPKSSGVYWVMSGENSLFMGAAQNLRTQIDSLIGNVGTQVTPKWLSEPLHQKPIMRLFECSAVASKEMQSALLRKAGSRLNFLMGSFLTGSAA